jgi:hypothetical protein
LVQSQSDNPSLLLLKPRVRRRFGWVVDGGAVHCVAARRVAAVGPVEKTVLVVELEIDGLRQTIEEDLDVDLVAGVWPAGISTLAR